MPYSPMLVNPMREELTSAGSRSCHFRRVDRGWGTRKHGAADVNSVCGCAAGAARPGIRPPSRVRRAPTASPPPSPADEATARALPLRRLPPASRRALSKDGELVYSGPATASGRSRIIGRRPHAGVRAWCVAAPRPVGPRLDGHFHRQGGLTASPWCDTDGPEVFVGRCRWDPPVFFSTPTDSAEPGAGGADQVASKDEWVAVPLASGLGSHRHLVVPREKVAAILARRRRGR